METQVREGSRDRARRGPDEGPVGDAERVGFGGGGGGGVRWVEGN